MKYLGLNFCDDLCNDAVLGLDFLDENRMGILQPYYLVRCDPVETFLVDEFDIG